MNMFRQGDILFMQVESVPENARSVQRINGRLIVAEGEVTGHAHAVADLDAQLLTIEATNVMYLDSPAPMRVVHEEHDTVALPAGTFCVIRQREYTPEAIRTVID